jgi:hypothetical protein
VVVKEIDTSVRVGKVYNLTVANTHNYFVGGDGVLVHNASKGSKEETVSIFKGPQRGTGQKQLKEGYFPDDFSTGDECVYFAKQRRLAEEYAERYGEGVIEVKVPKDIYNKRLKQYECLYQGGPYIELPIPHKEFDILNKSSRCLHEDPWTKF